MGCINKIQLDLKKSNDGICFKWLEDIEFLIARTNNPIYNAALAQVVADHHIKHGDKPLTEEQNEFIVRRACAIGCVKDWKNVTDEDDKPMAYDPEKMYEYLINPNHIMLWDFVWSRASHTEFYLLERKKKAVGN